MDRSIIRRWEFQSDGHVLVIQRIKTGGYSVWSCGPHIGDPPETYASCVSLTKAYDVFGAALCERLREEVLDLV